MHDQLKKTPNSSDPVIEPMLQTVPDPFDSYGPPPAEDQIFTILPPLSVIANTPSSAPSPLTASTPELESSSDGLPSGKNSWSSTGGFFPDAAAAAWADVPSSPPGGSPSPSSPSSGATSPARSVSPKLSSVNRRNSHPVSSSSSAFAHHTPRKSESKLRSVLSVLEEGAAAGRSAAGSAHQNGEREMEESHARSASVSAHVPSSSTNGKAPEMGGVDGGASVWGGSKSTLSRPTLSGLDVPPGPDGRGGGGGGGGGGEGDVTPRNTLRARAQSPPIPAFDYDGPSILPSPGAADANVREARSRSPQSDDTAIPSPVAS